MSDPNIKNLLEINDRIIADEIKRVLEENGIYSLLVSDNPASSFHRVYLGTTKLDHVTIQVNINDYPKAVDVIKENGYDDLLV